MGYQSHKRIDRKAIELVLSRAAVKTLSRLALSLPEGAALAMGSRLGALTFHLSKRYRTVTLANLRMIFGEEWEPRRIESTARGVFRHLGMNVVEFLRFPELDRAALDRKVTVEGEEHVRRALEQGTGALAVSAHLGNFELVSASMASRGYVISVIARDADDDATNELINGIRQRMNYRVLPRDTSARRGLTTLRSNEVLGMLPDQNFASGIFVPFFGRLAATAPGPAFMAIHSNAPVLPVFIHRESGAHHHVRIYPPLEYSRTGDRDTDIYNLTHLLNQVIEREIRLYPEQWFWLHNRWKTRPPGENTADNVRARAVQTMPAHSDASGK